MPTATYEQLLIEAIPQVIEAGNQYREIWGSLRRTDRQRAPRTRGETKLMRLLALLIEDYDRRHALPPDDATPAVRLQFLLEHSGKRSADLLPIFGQRSHVNEALNGKRKISAGQARKLARMFSVNAGLFI
jgi:antitoxin component HigA of HigAB toxin-antitoxin module